MILDTGPNELNLSAKNMIREEAIEATIEQLNASEEAYEEAVELFREEQPVVLAYLFSETFEPFSKKEQEFIFYLALVLFLSVRRERESIPQVSEEQLSRAEEHNWELLSEVKSKRFHERLDVFFEDSKEEDLLAFLEDALSDETDELVTKEGREAAFASLKAIVDCLATS